MLEKDTIFDSIVFPCGQALDGDVDHHGDESRADPRQQHDKPTRQLLLQHIHALRTNKQHKGTSIQIIMAYLQDHTLNVKRNFSLH